MMAQRRQQSTVEEINKLIAIPINLRCDDGRMFQVLEWAPRFAMGECATATLLVRIELPKDEPNG